MNKEQTIKTILDSIKLDVDDISKFEKEIDSVINMFKEVQKVDIKDTNSNLIKKQITLNNLREDEVFFWDFRKDMRGKYFKVPSVSKKK